jgi:hypothetical protein
MLQAGRGQDRVLQGLPHLSRPERGVRVMTSRGDDLTDSDDEMRVAMRQIVGVFSQLEKTRLVKKLKAARDRKKTSGKGRYIGRKSHVEKRPAVLALAKRLYRVNPKTGERRSLRGISADLLDAGYANEADEHGDPGLLHHQGRCPCQGPRWWVSSCADRRLLGLNSFGSFAFNCW